MRHDKTYWTTAEAAAVRGCTVANVHRLVRRYPRLAGPECSVVLGGRRLFTAVGLAMLVAAPEKRGRPVGWHPLLKGAK